MGVADEQLMLAYGGGDAAAFEALYGKHKGPLFRYVLRSVKSRGEAEELFQDIWMKVIEARARYTPQAKFTTWLYTIAHNRLVDHWRARSRRRRSTRRSSRRAGARCGASRASHDGQGRSRSPPCWCWASA